MTNDKKEEYKTELLIKECKIISDELITLGLFNLRVMGLGITVIIAGLVYGVKEKMYEILLLLPLMLLGLMALGLNTFIEALSKGGYKRYLEEKINAILGEKILLWESSIAKERHRSLPMRLLLFIIYIIFPTTFISICVYIASQHYEWSIVVLWGAVIVGLFIGFIISFYRTFQAFESTYQIAKRSVANQEVAISTSPNMAQKD